MPSDRHQATRHEVLDTRADSPMRKDPGALEEAQADQSPSDGRTIPRTEVPPSSGFTAVNGDAHRYTSFRPDDSAKPAMTSAPGRLPSTSDGETGVSHAAPPPIIDSARPQSWRVVADDENRASRDGHDHSLEHQPSSNKRKRDRSSSREPAVAATIETTGEVRSPIRHATGHPPTAPSADPSNTSGDRPNVVRAPFKGTYEREPSPIPSWNRTEPPAAPREEITSRLAESIQREFGSTQHDPDAESVSPTEENANEQSAQNEDESADQKKRKRQFSNRTKTGCHTCRARKKKCDEGRPICENCKRGNFQCSGYGPKPSHTALKQPVMRNNIPLQPSHVPFDPKVGPSPYPYGPDMGRGYPPIGPPPPPPPSEPPAPHRYNGLPPPPSMMDHHRSGSSRDSWQRPAPSWNPSDPHASYQPARPQPPNDYPPPPPPPPPQPYPHERPPQAGDYWNPAPSLPPPSYRPPGPPPSNMSGHSASSTSNPHRTHQLSMHATILRGDPPSERHKMLQGKPYKHFIDGSLIAERHSCAHAVRQYNKSAEDIPTHATGRQRAAYFSNILNPHHREPHAGVDWHGVPTGTIGARTVVESPFQCDFGYNLQLGTNVTIARGCEFQDACTIKIGDNTIIGPNVKLYCVTVSVLPSKRGGTQGEYTAGAITIEEDCVVGADVIIMPYRTIGRGSFVGAGSVVTRDVPPYTVVAGNPAKPVRRLEDGATNDKSNRLDIQEQNDAMLRKMRHTDFGHAALPGR